MQTDRLGRDRDRIVKNTSVPRWLSPASLTRVVRPEPSSGNRHGVMTPDHMSIKWPLPVMFGPENYSFSLIDLKDKRYEEEAAQMSQELSKLFSERQNVECEWRAGYKKFLEVEKRRNSLTSGVLQKSLDDAESELKNARETLLNLQAKRDEVQMKIQKIWNRCAAVKKSISKEEELERLRQSLTDTVKRKYQEDDQFWKSRFRVRSSVA